MFDKIQTSERLVLSCLSTAMIIENHYNTFLLPPPMGVYKIGQVEPCMLADDKIDYYYTSSNSESFDNHGRCYVSGPSMQPIVDINSVVSDVYDKNGRVIIPAFMMKDKQKYLTPLPTVPYRGIHVAEALIKNFISTISSIPERRFYLGSLERNFHTIPNNLIDDLESICKSLFLQIEEFMQGDLWHMYYTRRLEFDIVIEKTIDYRIHFYNTYHTPKDPEDDSS